MSAHFQLIFSGQVESSSDLHRVAVSLVRPRVSHRCDLSYRSGWAQIPYGYRRRLGEAVLAACTTENGKAAHYFVRHLVLADANVNLEKHGTTPLALAIQRYLVDTAICLLEAGARWALTGLLRAAACPSPNPSSLGCAAFRTRTR